MSKKSVTKRIRITRTGKMIRRKMAQGHFRANKAGRVIRRKRKTLKVDAVDIKAIKLYSN